MTSLSVNVDHVATVRQARGVHYPDPVEAAQLAEYAGADGITVHLRQDQRHIQADDVRRLREVIGGKLNLEIATAPAMLEVALDVRPDQVTLVPERPEEVTTEGGLDLGRHRDGVARAADTLRSVDIGVSLFLDPDTEAIGAAAELGVELVEGFEINTDRYTRAQGTQQGKELDKVHEAAFYGQSEGLRVFAGHGLTVHNVGPIASIEPIEELNIGHALISRAVLIGMEAAVREMLDAMASTALGDRTDLST